MNEKLTKCTIPVGAIIDRSTSMKNTLKNSKGITLIALVITIILLLILAGVTLNIVFNGGLIEKSQTAVDTYSEEQAKEKLVLVISEYKMGKITGEAGEKEGQKTLESYLNEIGGTITNGNEETSDTYTIELDGYEFIVKKDNWDITLTGKAIGEKPSIVKSEVIISDDKKSATIKVNASAKNGGILKVTINGQEVTLTDGTYNLNVIKNGTYKIIVEESGLTRKAVGSIKVEGIESTQIIVNGNNINGTEHGTLTGLAYKYNNPVIPAGFKIVETPLATWADANNDGIIDGWNNGLVIQDGSGNQFVWVPIHNSDVVENGVTIKAVPFARWTSTKNGNPTANNTSDDTDVMPVTTAEETTMVSTYGGFYIGRYESGIPSALTTAISTLSKAARNVTGTPVVKQNQIPWSYIDYTTASGNAKKVCEKTNVKSGLVTGRMWDATMKWIENLGGTNNENNVQTDSKKWGNHQNSPVENITEYSTNTSVTASWTTVTSQTKGTSAKWLLKTGHTEYTNRKNIYDLAGNLWEWTAEKYSSNRVRRGGVYNDTSIDAPAAYRSDYVSNSYTGNDLGFRVGLFIQ